MPLNLPKLETPSGSFHSFQLPVIYSVQLES